MQHRVLTEQIIRKYIEKASSILTECIPNFKVPKIIDIKVTKATSYWAQIRVLPGGYGLRVSKAFEEIPTEELFEERMTSCMIHEEIHTQPRCMNHKAPFKNIANKVNTKYPQYKIETGTCDADYGVASYQLKAKWIVECKTCGYKFYYARRPKYYKDMNSVYRCNSCKHSNFLVSEVHI